MTNKEIATPTAQVNTSTGEIVLSNENMASVSAFAKIMASGKSTLPSHLQGNQSDCMAIVIQAMQWKMNPYLVAQKTFVVSGTLGYEAQLVNAVVTTSGAIQGRFHYEYIGDWSNVIGNFKEVQSNKPGGKSYKKPNWSLADEKGCGLIISATITGEDEPAVLELLLSQATERNSTLWASDPKQQLSYLGVKRWSRLYCPAVMLGVYTQDELREIPQERDITPAPDGKPESALRRPGSDKPDIEGEAETVNENEQEAEQEPAVDAELVAVETVIEAMKKSNTIQGLSAAAALGEQYPNDSQAFAEMKAAFKTEKGRILRAQDEAKLNDTK